MLTGTEGHGMAGREGGASLVIVTAPMLDETLAALTHRRRRYVLYRLRERESGELDELARYVAAAEAGVSVGDVEEAAGPVETALAHSHLPRLDEAGLVDYDPRSGAVRYAHPPPILERILDICADVEAPET